MAVKPRFAACQGWVEGSASSCVASDAELLGYDVSVGQGQTEERQKVGKIIANVVNILLSVHKLVVSYDAVVGQEVVVCSSVQTRASRMEVAVSLCTCI